MGLHTKIESSDASWNPFYGCSKVSSGCQHCYAQRIAARSGTRHARRDADGTPIPEALTTTIYSGIAAYSGLKPHWTGKLVRPPKPVHVTEKTWEPLGWHGRMIAVGTMTDFFHERIPDEWRDEAYGVMALCLKKHTFQILTKRPKIMRRYFSAPDVWQRIEAEARRIYREIYQRPYPIEGSLEGPLPNVWHGVSVESQAAANHRVPLLLTVPSYRHFVAAEPLLGPIKLSRWLRPVGGVSWVIVSGEGGPEARLCDVDWIVSLVEQAKAAEVRIFVKQLGTATNVRGATQIWSIKHSPLDTRTRRGSEMDAWPECVRVREMPNVHFSDGYQKTEREAK